VKTLPKPISLELRWLSDSELAWVAERIPPKSDERSLNVIENTQSKELRFRALHDVVE